MEKGRAQHKVVLAYPYPVVREGLGMMIERDDRLDLLAQTGSPEETFEALTQLRNTGGKILVLVGLGFSGSHTSQTLIRAIRDRFPHTTVAATASNADMESVSRSLFFGADAFVDHIVEPSQFLTALCRAAMGETVLVGPPSEWLGPIADLVEQQQQDETLLTKREKEILAAAATGGTAQEIGEGLGLRPRTVTTHLGRIYGKLGVNSRIAAVSTASRRGLIPAGR